MKYLNRWKIRKIHIIVWAVISVISVSLLMFFLKEVLGFFDLLRIGLVIECMLLWMLPPLTITLARDGSVVSDFARKIPRFFSFGGSGGGTTTYNLNNAGDSFAFGIRIIIIFFRVATIGAWFAWLIIKYLVSYLIVMVPFPFETFYYYIKTREKVNWKQIVFPIVLCILVPMFVIVTGAISGYTTYVKEQKELEAAREEAASEFEIEYEEAITQEYDFSFGESYTLEEGEVKYVVIKESSVYLQPRLGTSITSVTEGTVFIGTGVEKKTSSAIWYEIYLDAEKSSTGWTHFSFVEIQE